MPRKANFIFDVHIRIPEAFTLDSIVRSPRTFKPKDVFSACYNNELVVKHGDPPPLVVHLATYVMTDFFAMAHATGLYNRQRKFWESLSQVNSIHVNQLSSGLFKKKALPIFDFSFLDYKGKPLVIANLVAELPEKKQAVGLLKEFIGRASGKQSLTGALAFFASPMPADVLDYVQRQTHTVDPIARYESVLPAVNVPFDLMELDKPEWLKLQEGPDEEAAPKSIYKLVHPDIRKGKITEPVRVMRKVMPKPKGSTAVADEVDAAEASAE